MTKKFLIFIFFSLLLFLNACVNEEDITMKITNLPEIFEINKTYELTLEKTNNNLQDFEWSSSNPEVASINNGILRTYKKGYTIITCCYKLNPKINDKVKINVLDEKTIKTTDLTIYAINDFHGMLFETTSGVGASKISQYLKENKTENTIILSAGDMFQGSAVSSMSRGKVVVDIMNDIGFDSMSVGNHEFDWGVNELTKFYDNIEENGEALFPIVVSNITDKNTGKLATWANPYTTFTKAGFKIGVVGVIGQNQESDILRTYINDYDFTDELTAIKKYTKVLREEKNCDIVIVTAHLDSTNINEQIANLKGSEYVDCIINGHTHQAYFGEIQRSQGANMPYVQSGSYGMYIGKITLTVDKETKKVVDSDVINLSTKNNCQDEDKNFSKIINTYQEYLDIASEKLGLCGENIYKDSGGVWSSNVLQSYFDASVGIVNTGGIRSSGFPIYKDDMITYGDVFEIMPFENMVRTVYLTGGQLIDEIFKYESSYYFSSNVDIRNLTIDDTIIDRSKLYKVATIDFLFEKPERPFLSGVDRVDTDVLFRDVLARAVKDCVLENQKFYTLG